MFPQIKQSRLRIIENILQKITNYKPQSLQDLNINIGFQIA